MNLRSDPKEYPRFSRQWPALAAVALLVAVGGWMVASAMARNGGKWIYPLDDAYIHLATVKHLVQHGVWGISYLNGFSSCLSSLLYPLLLAGCDLIFGFHESALLVLNLIASAAVIFYAGALVQRHTRSHLYTFAVLACAVLLTPLPVVAVGGMEHTWQMLIDLWLLDLAVRVLDPQEAPASARAAALWLPVAACLAVMIRFEGLFFVAIVGLLLLCRGRFWLAVGVGAAAALPLGVFGAYSVSKGWSFLPNSVLLKSGGSHSRGLLFGGLAAVLFAGLQWPRAARRLLPGLVVVAGLTILLPGPRARFLHAFGQFGGTLVDYAHLGILLLALTAALHARWRRHGTLWSRPVLLVGMLWVVTLQHLLFAGVGWLYRYEAYLMFLGVVVVGIALADAFPASDSAPWWRGQPPLRVAFALGLLGVCVAPLTVRAVIAYRLVPQASHNIYGQQYQMARFVRRFYNGAGVAANDIGAIDFFADLRVLDTWGLADRDVFQARRQGEFTQETIRRLASAHAVRVVMVYDDWATDFCGPLPEWVPVGRWTIPNNVICGGATVSFYAPDGAEAPRLIQALKEFAPDLPADTVQEGAYRGGPPPHVLGAFGPQDDAGGQMYPVPKTARFYLDPLKGRQPSTTGVTAGVVSLSLSATPQLQGIDVRLNGENVASWTPTQESPGHWTPLTARVRWREGENVLEIDGRGTAALTRTKARTPLFAVREPSWGPDAPVAP